MYSFFYRIIKSTIIRVLFLYKRYISPLLPNACRFQPSCSEYMIEAINEHGIIKGVYLGFIRICKCNPLGPSGYDPVPKSKKK